MAGVTSRAVLPDRFAGCPRYIACAVLVGFTLLLALATLTARQAPPPDRGAIAAADAPVVAGPDGQDDDLQLYRRIAERVAQGENYYDVAYSEQRARNFPVRPGLAVRPPTLAFIAAALGPNGLLVAAAALAMALAVTWWRLIGSDSVIADKRVLAMLLLLIGAAMGLKAPYLYLHEVWAGLLLALSFGLHRPGRWMGSWLAAGLALAIREHALPFVLLMGAMAAWRRDWREVAAWTVLTVLFVAGMALHLAEASQHILPSDRESPSWLVLRGLGGWTSNLVLSSVLHLLPLKLAAPLSLVPLLGWAAWRGPVGLFGALLHAGYGMLFMLAGRDNNFYWALVVIPTWFVGLVLVPRALTSLSRSALGKI